MHVEVAEGQVEVFIAYLLRCFVDGGGNRKRITNARFIIHE